MFVPCRYKGLYLTSCFHANACPQRISIDLEMLCRLPDFQIFFPKLMRKITVLATHKHVIFLRIPTIKKSSNAC